MNAIEFYLNRNLNIPKDSKEMKEIMNYFTVEEFELDYHAMINHNDMVILKNLTSDAIAYHKDNKIAIYEKKTIGDADAYSGKIIDKEYYINPNGNIKLLLSYHYYEDKLEPTVLRANAKYGHNNNSVTGEIYTEKNGAISRQPLTFKSINNLENILENNNLLLSAINQELNKKFVKYITISNDKNKTLKYKK